MPYRALRYCARAPRPDADKFTPPPFTDHPLPIQQCSQNLSRYPHCKIEYTESTSVGKEKSGAVANTPRPSGPWVAKRAGALYGLQVQEALCLHNQTSEHNDALPLTS